MKKIISSVLVIVMLFVLASCTSINGKDSEYVSGTVSNNVYTNTFAGITFTPGPEWTFSSEEEILELMDIATDYLSDEDSKNAEIAKQKTIIDMQAIDSSTGDNVIVQFENLSLYVGGTTYSEEDYAEATKQSLEGYNIEYSFEDYKTERIAGEDYLAFLAFADYQGVEVDQEILIRKVDNYMLCIILTSYDGFGAGVDALADMFTAAQ